MVPLFLTIPLGLVLGSFTNVCIYRIPRQRSLVTPRSFCPYCQRPIRWFDNIPLISFVLLRGRCRSCRHPIGWRYPIIEALCALCVLGMSLRYPSHLFLWGVGCFLIVTLLALSVIDLQYRIIPDSISYTLLIAGLASALANPLLGQGWGERVAMSLSGGLLGWGGLFMIAVAGTKIFRTEALGGGDIKLLAGLGTLLGWSGVIGTLLLASLSGALTGLLLLGLGKIQRKASIPFGPFLSAGAYLSWMFPDWWRVWVGTMGF